MPPNQEIEEGLRKGKREREDTMSTAMIRRRGLQVTRVTQYLSLKVPQGKGCTTHVHSNWFKYKHTQVHHG